MNPTRLRRPLAALVLGGTAAFLGAVLPAHAFSNPPIQVAQGIEYMCGGAAQGRGRVHGNGGAALGRDHRAGRERRQGRAAGRLPGQGLGADPPEIHRPGGDGRANAGALHAGAPEPGRLRRERDAGRAHADAVADRDCRRRRPARRSSGRRISTWPRSRRRCRSRRWRRPPPPCAEHQPRPPGCAAPVSCQSAFSKSCAAHWRRGFSPPRPGKDPRP
jgi:hypothetical protein